MQAIEIVDGHITEESCPRARHASKLIVGSGGLCLRSPNHNALPLIDRFLGQLQTSAKVSEFKTKTY